MGNLIPNSRWAEARRRRRWSKWTRADSYAASKPPSKNRRKSPRKRGASFPVAMAAVFAGGFSGVMVAPEIAERLGIGGIETQAAEGIAGPMDREEAYFRICSGPVRVTCVVDGDTIWYRGEKIRLVGFDTPEISRPGCANERRLGEEATRRLRDWLNAGAFSLEPNPEGRSHDRYDRALLVATRGGESVGSMMLAEGLAERRRGRGNVWC